MLTIYIYTILSVVIISLISLIGLFALSIKENLLRKYTFILVSLAIGALLGDAFIHLIPESFSSMNALSASLLIIGGIFFFFVFEKVLHWHHHYRGTSGEYCDKGICKPGRKISPLGNMILVGDGIHNFLDGIIIGASYLISIEIGIATTIAVFLHEIPQEIGDFGVLIHAGYTKRRALFLNLISAILAILGAVIVLLLNEIAEPLVVLLIPIAAGGFIYIAASDLIPELHKIKGVRDSFLQLIAIAIGIAAMVFLLYIEAENPEPPNDFIKNIAVTTVETDF